MTDLFYQGVARFCFGESVVKGQGALVEIGVLKTDLVEMGAVAIELEEKIGVSLQLGRKNDARRKCGVLFMREDDAELAVHGLIGKYGFFFPLLNGLKAPMQLTCKPCL